MRHLKMLHPEINTRGNSIRTMRTTRKVMVRSHKLRGTDDPVDRTCTTRSITFRDGTCARDCQLGRSEMGDGGMIYVPSK